MTSSNYVFRHRVNILCDFLAFEGSLFQNLHFRKPPNLTKMLATLMVPRTWECQYIHPPRDKNHWAAAWSWFQKVCFQLTPDYFYNLHSTKSVTSQGQCNQYSKYFTYFRTNTYIFIASALDETSILVAVHFSTKIIYQ